MTGNEEVIAVDELRRYLDKVERLEMDKSEITEQIKQVYDAAGASGFDIRAMKALIKMRKIDDEERTEREAIIGIYKRALGMKSGEEDI